MLEMLKNLTKNRAAAMSLHDLLDQAREAMADAKARRIAIEGAPQDLDAALASFDAWMDQAATDAVDRLGVGYALDPDWRGPKLPVILNGGHRDATPATEILLGLIALTGRDTLRRVVRGQIEDRMGGEAGMTASTRTKKAAEAMSDILQAEFMEERIVRTMEAAGVSVSRRADADPRALLADEQLSSFRGELDAKGKPDLLLKHLNRASALRANLDDLRKFTGISDPTLEDCLVFSGQVPMGYAKEGIRSKANMLLFDEIGTLALNT